jgi:hypothetical protein
MISLENFSRRLCNEFPPINTNRVEPEPEIRKQIFVDILSNHAYAAMDNFRTSLRKVQYEHR